MSIASASTTVKFHEFPSGNVVHNYLPATYVNGPIRSISWSKDGNWLSLVPHSGLVEIVSVKDQLKLIHTVNGIEEPSCAVFQNTTKKSLAIGSKNGQVFLYDIKARSVKKRFPGNSSAVTRVQFTAKDNHIISSCESGEIFLYSNVTNNLSGTFKIPRSHTVSALRTSPIKRNYLMAGSDEGVVAVWDIHGNKNKFYSGSHKASVTAVAFSPISADLVISTGLDRQFCFYDLGSGKCIGNIFVENNMTAVDFSPDGKFIVLASQKGKIYIYDSKKITEPVHTFVGHNDAIHHLSFRKCEEYETSFEMSAPEIPQEARLKRVGESPNTPEVPYAIGEKTVDATPNSKNQMSLESEDSFLRAIGLGKDTPESAKLDHSGKTTNSSKQFFMSKLTPTAPQILHEEIPRVTLQTSTPISNNEETFPVTPLPQAALPHISNLENKGIQNVGEFIKATMKEELSTISTEFKYQMETYFSDARQMSLGLLMHMVKDSIKVENNINNLRTELYNLRADLFNLPSNFSEESLLEENLRLKEKISVMAEELSMLRNRHNNNVL